MARVIRITAGAVLVTAELNETHMADAIWQALPIDARASTWGDEVYFPIPVAPIDEPARAVVQMGDIAYWPPGKAFCAFFGPTPASNGEEIRPASPVNVVGRIQGDAKVLRRVPSGAKVGLERVEASK